MTSPPIWIVALVCAALAPWAARALQAYFERRVRRRTLAFLASVRAPRALPRADGEGTAERDKRSEA